MLAFPIGVNTYLFSCTDVSGENARPFFTMKKGFFNISVYIAALIALFLFFYFHTIWQVQTTKQDCRQTWQASMSKTFEISQKMS